jgi:tetratricopeptide (TPR) repeat protein
LSFSAYGILSLLRGQALYFIGRLEEGAQELQRTLGIAAEAATPELACWAHYNMSVAASFAGDGQRTLDHAQRLVEITLEIGSPAYLLGISHSALAIAHLAAGRWDEAAESARAGLAVRRESSSELQQDGVDLTDLALALLGAGEWVEAYRVSEQAIDICRRTPRPFDEARAHCAQALALLRSEGSKARGEIEEALGRAESLVRETGGRALAPQIQEARAEVARALEGEAEWQRELREAHRLFLEIGATGHAARVAKELGM